MTRERVALVTGGGRGIGRAISLQLAADGLDVTVAYQADKAAAAQIARQVRDAGQRSVALRADLRDAGSALELVDRIVSELGRLDALISNAGCLRSSPFLETTPDDYDLQADTNARGAFFIAQAAAKQMIKQHAGGHIVFITSKAAVRPARNMAVYAMSKASVKMLTEAAAIELAPYGIMVNAVAPGTVETDLNRALLEEPQTRRNLLGTSLLDRPGNPEDIAHAVSFLLSDRAGFITGCTLAVDGGSAISPGPHIVHCEVPPRSEPPGPARR